MKKVIESQHHLASKMQFPQLEYLINAHVMNLHFHARFELTEEIFENNIFYEQNNLL